MVNEIIDNISTQLDSVKEYGQSLVLQGSETSPLTSCTLIQRFADRRSNAEPLAPMQSGNCIEIPGVPVRLMQPYGWSCRADGIYKDEAGKLQTLICRTPIVLTRRLCSAGDIEEQIEIAFFRDGKWKFASFLRSVLFSARHVVDLADLGCTVTSSHSKDLVEYFGALEAENIDLIPKVSVATYFGWQPSAGFLPGHAGDVVLNPDLSTLGSAICQLGTLEEWVKQMAAYRSNPVFRAVLSAGFAAPLLRIVNQRSFFVHNWGNSRSGKTAALKAALSAWGDPDKLMVNFNATPVGLERTAAIYHDLPLGVDERQLAGTNQDEIEKIVYMLSNGIGKTSLQIKSQEEIEENVGPVQVEKKAGKRGHRRTLA